MNRSKYQEEKLRKDSKSIANRDIKCIGKLSKQDWNVKCFENPNERNAVENEVKRYRIE